MCTCHQDFYLPELKHFFSFLKDNFINIKLKECSMHECELDSHENLNYEGKLIFYNYNLIYKYNL